MYTYRKSVDIPSHAFMTQGELEEPAEASVQLQMVSAAEIMKISFFQCRIDHCYIYTYSNGIDIMFDAVITKGVLEQLVNTFNAAADGICRKILKICFF